MARRGMQFGSDVKPAAGQTVTFKADKGTVNATKVRIVNTVNNDYMNATENSGIRDAGSGCCEEHRRDLWHELLGELQEVPCFQGHRW